MRTELGNFLTNQRQVLLFYASILYLKLAKRKGSRIKSKPTEKRAESYVIVM